MLYHFLHLFLQTIANLKTYSEEFEKEEMPH